MAKARNPIKGKLNKSLAKHASDKTTASQEYIDLPPGIQGGVATLVDAKLGVYQSGDNEGEQFMYLAGVVVEPVEHTYNPKIFINGKIETQEAITVKVRGQRTSLMIPWCDTTNSRGKITSADEHVEDSLNRLRQLGADTSEIQEQTANEDLEAIFKALVEVAPVFKFGTRSSNPNAQYPTPMTWESWYGSEGLEDYEVPDGDEVVDETEDDDKLEEDEEPEENDEDREGEDIALKSLGKLADIEEKKGDDNKQEARNRLTEMCEDLEIDPDEFDSWSDVVTAIEDAGEEEDTEEENIPQTEEVWQYKPPKKRKFVDVQVISMSSKRKTVNLKNLEDGKTLYKGIPFSLLQASEDNSLSAEQ